MNSEPRIPESLGKRYHWGNEHARAWKFKNVPLNENKQLHLLRTWLTQSSSWNVIYTVPSKPRRILWSVTKGTWKVMSGTGKGSCLSDDSWLPEKEPIYLMQVKGNNSFPTTSSRKDHLPALGSQTMPHIQERRYRAQSHRNGTCHASLINNLHLLYLAKWVNLGSEFCPIQQVRIITLPSLSSCS